MNKKGHISRIIEEKAESLGFSAVGFAPVHPLDDEKEHLERYFSAGWHADMEYLRKGLGQRLDPALRFQNARTVIVLAINYYPGERTPAAPASSPENRGESLRRTQGAPLRGVQSTSAPEVEEVSLRRGRGAPPESLVKWSRYVYGKDYHAVIGEKLKELSRFILKEGATLASYYVDDSSFLEKKWAALAGIGWRGKNSLIFHLVYGSWIFLGEIITDLELASSGKVLESRCGECALCMDFCPTGAIETPFMVNASRCIAYQTLDNNEAIPEPIRSLVGDRIYGCDICQEVCPENKTARRTKEPQFFPNDPVLDLTLPDILQLEEKRFLEIFEGTAMKRNGRSRLLRNACLVAANLVHERKYPAEGILEALKKFLEDEDPILKAHAAWALGNVRGTL